MTNQRSCVLPPLPVIRRGLASYSASVLHWIACALKPVKLFVTIQILSSYSRWSLPVRSRIHQRTQHMWSYKQKSHFGAAGRDNFSVLLNYFIFIHNYNRRLIDSTSRDERIHPHTAQYIYSTSPGTMASNSGHDILCVRGVHKPGAHSHATNREGKHATN